MASTLPPSSTLRCPTADYPTQGELTGRADALVLDVLGLVISLGVAPERFESNAADLAEKLSAAHDYLVYAAVLARTVRPGNDNGR
jgi:hypothetical protein